MSAKLLSGYSGPNFSDADHPGNGLPYLILNGNQKGSFDWEDTIAGNAHRVTFCIPWEGIAAFRQYVLAGTSSGGGPITRTLPMLSPFAAIFPNTYATRITGKGDGSDHLVTAARLYEDCILVVEFATLRWDPLGSQPFIEVNNRGSADYTTIPNSSLAFSGGERILHDASVMIGSLAIEVTAHQIPDITTWKANLMPLKGKVSSTTVTIRGYTHPAGTLLFPTFESQESVDSLGVATAEGTITLLQRDISWNSGITSSGAVEAITPAPYLTADLNGVFTA